MKAGWQTTTLGEIIQLPYGKPLDPKDRNPNGLYPAYGANGEKDRTDKFYRDSPSIIIGRKGSAGEITLTEDRFWPLDVTYFVEFDHQQYDLQFLYYLLVTLDLPNLAKGVKPGINRNEVYALPVSVPSLPEQQRIVTLLDEAFDGIAAARAHAEKNLQNARAIFDRHLESLFSGQSPGWSQTTVGEQLTLQRGFDITKNQQRDGTVPVVSSGGIKSFHDTPMAKAPGVVIGRKGTLGKTYYLGCDYWPHDTTLWVKDFKGNVPRFVYYLLLGLNVKHLDSGAANPALNRNQVHPLKISWPPLSQQDEFTLRLDSLGEETQRLESLYQRKLTALDELTKSLLDQAFSGAL